MSTLNMCLGKLFSAGFGSYIWIHLKDEIITEKCTDLSGEVLHRIKTLTWVLVGDRKEAQENVKGSDWFTHLPSAGFVALTMQE